MPYTSITEQLNEAMASLAPSLGEYSLSKHILVCMVLLALVVAVVVSVVNLRGQPPHLAVACSRDVVIGGLFCLTGLLFPVGLYFLGKAFYQAFFFSQTPSAT